MLNEQKADTRKLVANTGVVFDALTERGDQLRSLIENSNRVFATTASRNRRLQEIFTIFPTFLDESRATTTRLTQFSRNANPLITQLRPAARELSPTLIDLKSLAPDLKGLFRDLGPLITVSRRGLPAVRRILDDTTPLLGQLEPFLRNLNPMLDYLGLYKREIVGFFANDAASTQSVDRPPGSNRDPLPAHRQPAQPGEPGGVPGPDLDEPVEPVRRAGRLREAAAQGVRHLPLHQQRHPDAVRPERRDPGSADRCRRNVTDLLPDTLRDGVNQFALSGGTVPAPPCTEQAPLGQAIGETGKYPQLKAAPARR